ncbi:hypothetical protein Tco_1091230 [Tanacetum coccineum]|uniref:Uncharacterized protein n=1 Tax=Tanacetum coccineum TaxID=301880 RepID=A0ABQ5I8C2_9ASTR
MYEYVYMILQPDDSIVVPVFSDLDDSYPDSNERGATANEQPHFASHKARRSSFSTASFELLVGFHSLLEMRPMQKLAAQLANKYADDSGVGIRLLFVRILNGARRIRKLFRINIFGISRWNVKGATFEAEVAERNMFEEQVRFNPLHITSSEGHQGILTDAIGAAGEVDYIAKLSNTMEQGSQWALII